MIELAVGVLIGVLLMALISSAAHRRSYEAGFEDGELLGRDQASVFLDRFFAWWFDPATPTFLSDDEVYQWMHQEEGRG